MVKINMREGQNKLTLKAQVLSNFFAVGIIPLIVFVAITSIIVSSSMYNSQVSSLRQISSMAAKNVDKWGDDNSLLVEDIANSQIVKSNDLEGIQKELKNKQAQDTSISNIMYTDVNGNIIKDSKGSVNESVQSKEYFKGVSKGYSYISNVFWNDSKDVPLVVFSCPVKKDNLIVGYIIADIKVLERI